MQKQMTQAKLASSWSLTFDYSHFFCSHASKRTVRGGLKGHDWDTFN
jgi:hypothetical protein